MYQRLPQKYIPKHYDLFIHVTPKQIPFDAMVTITFQKLENDNKALLNIYSNIHIKSITQNNIPLRYTISNSILVIDRSTQPEQDISSFPITINYSVVPITSKYEGFYSCDDCCFTQFEPNKAQTLLPCFDDPSVRSTFSVKIQIPSNLTGLSNMPIESIHTINDAETLIHFQQTPQMCSYLLAIFIGEFDHIEGQTKNGTPVKMYSEKVKLENIKPLLDAAIFSLNWMEEKTSAKYELPALHLLSHKGLKIGMENYGLIALRDYTRDSDFLSSILVVMHEVSHLWFSDLVSIFWWDSIFLNEGFAEYFMYLILRDFSDEYSNKSIQYFTEVHGIKCIQFFREEKIVVNENEIDLIEDPLKNVVYIKGAFVLKMFSDLVGEVSFFKICSNWIKMYKNKNATVDQFISFVNSSLNDDYTDFFNTWLRKVGLPVLKIEEICDKDSFIVGVRISQVSFDQSIYQFKLSLLYESEGEMKKIGFVMKEKNKEINVRCNWILVNEGMKSLCAVFYSNFLLKKLCLAKKEGKISLIDSKLIEYSTYEIADFCNADDDFLDMISENFDSFQSIS